MVHWTVALTERCDNRVRRRASHRRALVAVLLLALAAGCGYETPLADIACVSDADCGADAVCGATGYCVASADPENIDPGPVLASVMIAPDSAEIALGESVELEATALDSEGAEFPDVTFTWSSSDDNIATVDQTGLVTAVNPGSATITVAADAFSATAEVIVLAPVDTVVVTPDAPTVGLGTTLALTATPFDGNGEELTNRAVEWSVDDDTILDISDDGSAIAIGIGSATVTATIEGVDGSTEVSVEANPVSEVSLQPDDGELAVGSATEFVAVIEDGEGNVLDPRGRTFEWALDNFANAALAFDPNRPEAQRVVANSLGVNRLTVTVDETASTELGLTIVPATVEIEALTDIVPVGSERQLVGTVQSSSGADVTGGTRTWMSSDETVATVDGTGLLSALAPGTTTITFDVDGVQATLEVEVLFLLDQISAGAKHSCGVSPDGVGFCWGDNSNGELGVGATPASSGTPLIVSGDVTWTEIVAGDGFSCGLDAAGAAHCWGAANRTGRTDGAASDVPVAVDGGHTFVAIDATNAHTCAIADTDKIYCWGDGGAGRLGDGQTSTSSAPTEVLLTANGIPVDVAAGAEHSCTVTDMTETFCWGKGAEGALGNGNSDDASTPVQASTNESFVEVTAGFQVTCARTAANDLFCWGTNAVGQLGIGDLSVTSATTPTFLAGEDVAQVSLGEAHGCYSDPGDVVRCWGEASDFRLGNGDDSAPVDAPTMIANITAPAVDSGSLHTCAVADDGRPHCWGSNSEGRSGTDAGTSLQQPTLVW